MALDYRIGSTIGTMATLVSLGIQEPQIVPVHYAEYIPLGDGSMRGAGWLQCEWRWGTLDKWEVTQLRTLCPEPDASASVAIKTVKSGGGMENYNCTLIWPQIEPAAEGDWYEDVVFMFIQMIRETST